MMKVGADGRQTGAGDEPAGGGSGRRDTPTSGRGRGQLRLGEILTKGFGFASSSHLVGFAASRLFLLTALFFFPLDLFGLLAFSLFIAQT